MDSGIFLGFGIAACIAMLALFGWFLFRFFIYGYVGNLYFYVGCAFAICVVLSLVVYTNPIPINSTETLIVNNVPKEIINQQNNVNYTNPLQIIGASLFEAIKMMAMAFEKDLIAPFFRQKLANGDPNKIYSFFGGVYYVASGFALITTSISVIIFVAKSFWAKLMNVWHSLKFWNLNKVYYIFSEAKVAGAAKNLARALKNEDKKAIVIMYVTKASLKTQEGTEYRDALINEGLDVRSEAFSKKLCSYLFKKFFNRRFTWWFFWFLPYRNRQITVYGLFDTDDASINLATNFTAGIVENTYFQKVFKKYLDLKPLKDKDRDWPSHKKEDMRKDLDIVDNFKVFITYQDHDIDLNNDFSGQTLHIVNTLSQYDMVSSEFILNNPLSDFLPKSLNSSNKDCFNVSFFGFGSINRPIYEKMTYAYQSSEDNTHKIHYHIYDLKADEIVEKLKNEYTISNDPKKPNVLEREGYYTRPLLYGIDSNCSGKDLTSYEVLSDHFSKISNSARFNKNGFELFIVSAATTNQDIKIAFSLREVLLKTFTAEQLQKTYIFVRISKEHIVENLISANSGVVFRQKEKVARECAEKEANKYGSKFVPIIIFGEDTNMANFIRNDYDKIIKLGLASFGAYHRESKKDQEYWNDEVEQLSWLLLSKYGVLTNTATTYSIGTKLSMIGYRLGKKDVIFKNEEDSEPVSQGAYISSIESAIKGVDYPNINPNANPENKKMAGDILKLAKLEHNRWLATVYDVYRYKQLSQQDFKARNKENIDKLLAEKDKEKRKTLAGILGINTKSSDTTSHICMTTNSGLEKLYDDYKDLYSDEAKKLVFGNDVNGMRYMFLAFTNKKSKAELDKAGLDLLFFNPKGLVHSTYDKDREKTIWKADELKISIYKNALSNSDAEVVLMTNWTNESDDEIKETKKALMINNIGWFHEIKCVSSLNEEVNKYIDSLKANNNVIHNYAVLDYKEPISKEEKKHQINISLDKGSNKAIRRQMKKINKRVKKQFSKRMDEHAKKDRKAE